MTLGLKFKSYKYKNQFLDGLNLYLIEHNLHYKFADFGYLLIIDKNGNFAIDELIFIVKLYQDIDNIHP